MAKIITKNSDEIMVSEEKAIAISEFLEEKRKDEEKGGMSLSMFPVTVETLDGGLWMGNLNNISQILINEKKKTFKYHFKSEESMREFHVKYGYGGNKDKFEPGYGLMDVETQFLLATGQAQIVEGKLIIATGEKREYWSDLWAIYKSKLDVFNELQP